ncbi:MAG: hypothetical protein JW828_11090, partial [Sedimentisphaerales bacterium]|nr:hypothetical protein [Sedimentisphaerales bacterium]
PGGFLQHDGKLAEPGGARLAIIHFPGQDVELELHRHRHLLEIVVKQFSLSAASQSSTMESPIARA